MARKSSLSFTYSGSVPFEVSVSNQNWQDIMDSVFGNMYFAPGSRHNSTYWDGIPKEEKLEIYEMLENLDMMDDIGDASLGLTMEEKQEVFQIIFLQPLPKRSGESPMSRLGAFLDEQHVPELSVLQQKLVVPFVRRILERVRPKLLKRQREAEAHRRAQAETAKKRLQSSLDLDIARLRKLGYSVTKKPT
jgi:hypothetical protein